MQYNVRCPEMALGQGIVRASWWGRRFGRNCGQNIFSRVLHNPGEFTLDSRACHVPVRESAFLTSQVEQLMDETKTSPVRAMCMGNVPAIPHSPSGPWALMCYSRLSVLNLTALHARVCSWASLTRCLSSVNWCKCLFISAGAVHHSL